MSESTNGHSNSLTYWIVGAIVAAIAFSLALPAMTSAVFEAPEEAIDAGMLLVGETGAITLGGDIFLKILFALVVPLVVTSVMAGILSMGDVRKLGKPGLAAIGYYFSTTVLAVATGIALANMFQPGVGTISAEDIAAAEAAAHEMAPDKAAKIESDETTAGDIVRGLLDTIFTKNLIKSAAENQLLPLIVFSIVFAGILTTMGTSADLQRKFIIQLNDALMRFIMLVMKLSPFGIFCLVAGRFGRASLEGAFVEELQKLGWYAATVVTGLMFHALVTIPLIYFLLLRKNPFAFLGRMGQALLMAFSTSSSSATLPVTMETAELKAGVSKKAAGFVLPLGATVNMDGTALYEATAALFLAQVSGLDLGFGQQLVIAVTATLAAIGAAGVPEAGLVTMLIVLKAVKLDPALVTLILPIDWFLDRVRTTVNVFGDAAGAAILTPMLPDDGSSDQTDSTDSASAESGDAPAKPHEIIDFESDTKDVVELKRSSSADEPQTTAVVERPATAKSPVTDLDETALRDADAAASDPASKSADEA